MTQEIIYTSAPRGLKPSSQGFCTVASTPAMPQPVASLLEGQTGYRPLFPPGDSRESDNPVNWSHLRVSTGGRAYSLLARIAADGLDYSGRNNKLAHMLLVEASERVPGGPAWCLSQPSVMEREWTGEPRILPHGRRLPGGAAPANVCSAWDALTGDAGWAGVLAEAFLADPSRPAYLFFEPGCDLLPLFVEAIALLPEERRWEATFSTYFTSLSPNVECQWRCVVKGSAEANDSRRFVKALRIDLTTPPGRAEGGALVEWARTGRDPRTTGVAPTVETEAGAEGEEFPTWTGEPNDGLNGGTPPAANEPENVPGATARGTQRNATGVGGEYRLGAPAYTLPGQVAVPPPPRRRVSGRRRGWIVAVLCIMASIAAAAGGAFVLMGRPGPKIEPPAFALTATEPVVVVIGEAKTVPLLDQPLPPGWKVRFVKEPVPEGFAVLNEDKLSLVVRNENLPLPCVKQIALELASDLNPEIGVSEIPLPRAEIVVLIVPAVETEIASLTPEEASSGKSAKRQLVNPNHVPDHLTMNGTIRLQGVEVVAGVTFDDNHMSIRIDPKTANDGTYEIELTASSTETKHKHVYPKITLVQTASASNDKMDAPVETKPSGPKELQRLDLTFTRGRGFKVPVLTGATDVALVPESKLPDGVKLSALGYLEGALPKAGNFEFQCIGNSNGNSVLQKVLVNVNDWFDPSVVEAASDGETRTEQLLALPQASFDPTIASFATPKHLSSASLLDMRLHMPTDSQLWRTTRAGSANLWNIEYAEAGTQLAGTAPKAYYKIEVHPSEGKLDISIADSQNQGPSETPNSFYLLSLGVLECVYSTGHSRLFTLAPAIPARSGQLLGSGFELTNDKWERYVGNVLGRLYSPGDGAVPQKSMKVVLRVSPISLHQPETAPAERLYAKPFQPDNAGGASTSGQTLYLNGALKDDLVLAQVVHQDASVAYLPGLSSCKIVLRKNDAGRIWIGAVFTFDNSFLEMLDKEERLVGGKSFEKDGVVTERLREPLDALKSAWALRWGEFAKRLRQECPTLTSLHKVFGPMMYEQALVRLDNLQLIEMENQKDIENANNVIRKKLNSGSFSLLQSVRDLREMLMEIKASEKAIDWVDRVRTISFSMRIDLEYSMDSPDDSVRPRRRLLEINR